VARGGERLPSNMEALCSIRSTTKTPNNPKLEKQLEAGVDIAGSCEPYVFSIFPRGGGDMYEALS
jgi:hypothetical protein